VRPFPARYRCFPGAAIASLWIAAAATSACTGSADHAANATATGADSGTPAAATPAKSDGTKPTIDACALVTKAEVEAITKATVLDGKPEEMATLSSCSFGDPAHPMFRIVGVSVFVGGNAGQVKDLMAMAKSNAGTVEAVAGLGDDAYWSEPLHTLTANKSRFQIDVTIDHDAGGRDAAKAISAKVISRLP
jgi:hypothetical protein